MTDIEKKAREYAEQPANANTWGKHKRALANAFLAGATYALNNQWRDVEKEKPKACTDVAVVYCDRITNANCMAVGWIDNNSRWHSNDDDVNVYGIVAWLEIPEYKPKGE